MYSQSYYYSNNRMQYLGIYGFRSDETPSISRIILNHLINFIPRIIFWAGVFYVTKDKEASWVGFSIAFLGQKTKVMKV